MNCKPRQLRRIAGSHAGNGSIEDTRGLEFLYDLPTLRGQVGSSEAYQQLAPCYHFALS